MEYATIHISGSRAAATAIMPITAGTVGGRVALSFDKAWEGFQKTLVWQGSGRTIDDLRCTGMIPAEVLTRPYSPLILGVYGTKEEQVLPTVWVELGQIQPGADPSGDESADPALPVWAQIPQLLEAELQKAKDSGEFNGPQGEKGEPGNATIDDSSVTKDFVWSSNHIVDKLCPNIFESGPVVACQPLAGYPLTVQTDGATKVYRGGKNLIPPWAITLVNRGVTFKGNGDGSITFTGTPTVQWASSCYIDIPPEILKGGKTYSCTPASNSNYVIFFRWKDVDGNWKRSDKAEVVNRITWDDSWSGAEIQIYCPNIEEYNETVWLQLELGETATDYEPYVREEFAPGEAIPVLDGVNTFWADSGAVTVTGKADPVALFEKLTRAIG